MVLRLLFFLSCCALITACGAVNSSSVQADDTLRRYHDGQRWVEVRVLLDRLLVERIAAPQREGGAREVYLLRTPVASVAALEDVARQMRAAQPDIRTLSAYVRPVDTPSAEPRRLTREIVVSVNDGVDLASLLERHGVRLAHPLDYLPGAMIGEVVDARLLAPFACADAIRQESGIRFALPLIEQGMSRRDR